MQANSPLGFAWLRFQIVRSADRVGKQRWQMTREQ